MIQKEGNVSESEMYKVFNMGIGVCVVVPREEIDKAIGIAEKSNKRAFVLGKAVRDQERKIVLKKYGSEKVWHINVHFTDKILNTLSNTIVTEVIND